MITKKPDDEGEEALFKPLAAWLESKGYYSLITHGRKDIGLWIGDLFPSKTYIQPDVVGVRSSFTDTICIEAKEKVKGEKLFEILGKCRIWKLVTDKVYLAYPKQVGFKILGFQKLNIGLLEVSNSEVKEVFPPKIEAIYDISKSQELFNQVWNVIRSEPRESKIQITEINSYKWENKWNVTVSFRNTGSNELMLTELLINRRSYQEIPNVKLTSKPISREKPRLVEPFKQDYIYIEITESTLFKSGSEVNLTLKTKEGEESTQKVVLS